jgi:hypothetical protein
MDVNYGCVLKRYLLEDELLMSEGRIYGSALHKMEPKKLAKASAQVGYVT